ncbi:MAG: methyltransferase domain-containing protein [Candidatus Micrarchaeota archaeon]|nr:methyltransferase domain-containing protein [Candidatus Micrarchaeota archaeon]
MFIYPKMYRKLKRGPQVILPKDIGIIIAYTGANKQSVCVDAGTGSGWLAVSLASIAHKVYSYDLREDFLEIAKKNKEALGLENLTLKKGDVTKKITEKNVDIVTLDLPGSEKALKNAHKALKKDGSVVGYLPNAEQVKKFVSALNKLKFYDVYTVEVIVRDILVRKEGMRPTNTGLWHTAYLVFARKA